MILNDSTSTAEGRKIRISLWDVEDLSNTKLEPCVFQTTWEISEGRLNAKIIEKSQIPNLEFFTSLLTKMV